MIVESSNPAHSLADSHALPRGVRRRSSCSSSIDVAMTETARLRRLRAARGEPVREARGDVLQPRVPAQHLPPAPPADGAAAGDAARAGDLGPADAGARRRRRRGRSSRCARPRAAGPRGVRGGVPRRPPAADPRWRKVLPYVLYETLGPTLPDGPGRRGRAVGARPAGAMTYPDAVRRAGHADGDALFDAILDGPLRDHVHASTSTRTTSRYIATPDQRIALEIPEMLDRARGRSRDSAGAADERRVPDRAVGRRAARLHRQRHLPRPGLAQARRRRRAAGQRRGRRRARPRRRRPRADHHRRGRAEATVEVSDAMLPGHASLPNGFGLDFIDADGRSGARGGAERADVH